MGAKITEIRLVQGDLECTVRVGRAEWLLTKGWELPKDSRYECVDGKIRAKSNKKKEKK